MTFCLSHFNLIVGEGESSVEIILTLTLTLKIWSYSLSFELQLSAYNNCSYLLHYCDQIQSDTMSSSVKDKRKNVLGTL
jgi:hypothetical protein